MTSNHDPDVRGDVRAQIREFLTSRRARITPQQAGLPVFESARRRVPGLRREEAAMLAGISSEYYVRLERGDATGISEGVVDGIVHALQLDDAERSHLLDLLRVASSARAPRRRPTIKRVRPTVQRIIDSMVGTPAFVLNGRLDVLASRAVFDSHLTKENDLVVPLLAATPGVSLHELLGGMHQLLGDASHATAADADEVSAGCGGHTCSCGEVDGPGYPELDVRSVPHAIRHATIFGALESVRPGAGLELVAPHDPLPLLDQVNQRWPGRFSVTYSERGPEAWRLTLVRTV
jgi:uncharacterized protein (DUF2249 family)